MVFEKLRSASFRSSKRNSRQKSGSESQSARDGAAPASGPASGSAYKLDFGPNDRAIAIMGVTGTGKSTFVSLFTDEQAKIGHTLSSCTTDVTSYAFQRSPNQKIHLIDTPGFDDTTKSDTEVLGEIAGYLGFAYKNNIRLSGIIYLHRIIDPKLQGSAMKNLRMFKKLCGENSLSSVVLVTTWWDSVNEAQGNAREAELVNTQAFWGGMVGRGSKVIRHDGSHQSGMAVIDYLLRQDRPVVLDIQEQMINQGKKLNETAAGKELHAEIEELKKRLDKQMAEAREERKRYMKEKDMQSARDQERLEKEFSAKLAKAKEDQQALRADMNELRGNREQQFAEERKKIFAELKTQLEQNQSAIREKEFEMEKMKLNHSHQLNSQAMENQLEMMKMENARIMKQMENSGSCAVM